MNSVVISGLVALVVAYALTPVVRKIALALTIVAHPGGRRVHSRPTPLMGGVAMYAGFVGAVLLVTYLEKDLILNKATLGILAGATFVAIIGVIDDKFELPGWFQAGCIVLSGGILAYFGVRVLYLTNPFGHGELLWLGAWSVPVTLIWVLVVTKAVDCMDGLDGLAAGICAIAALTLMLLALTSGPRFLMSAVMSAALLGSALGFLRYNYPPAKVFMGTVGAQFLGFALAGISISGAFKIAALVAVAAPILVLGVPIFDTAFVVLRRAASGRKIHEADTTHLHHRLIEKGLSHRQVIWVIYGLTALFCAAAYALFSFAR